MDVEALFGSRVRAQTLEALALTPRPLSAYRVAKAIEVQPIQVLTILKRLEPAVEHIPGGWVLRNDSLRRFLLSEIRGRDWARREEKDELLVKLEMTPSFEHRRGRVR